ncbi:MAG: hypothetical protein A4S09_14580 [Proteobacteria bacterium SG_bin7]|nr:MAG: hypothetical protein A4S09_14580 [Proteobacteria bacterium SG_bin7]
MKSRGSDLLKAISLGLSGLLMCSLTYVMGAAPLLALRSYYGRILFLLSSLALVAGAFLAGHYFLAALFVAQILLVAIYAELELQGLGFAISGLLSVLLVSGFTAVLSGAYVHFSKINMTTLLQDRAKAVIENVHRLNASVNIDVDYLIAQVPSGLVVSFILSLALAVLLERSIAALIGAKLEKKSNYYSLLSFELPDVCVWITIIGIAGVGLKLNSPLFKTLGINILNIMATLYFFQGLAVAFSFFRTFRIGILWQALWAFVMVFQLFLFVAVLGFADYWLDIRKRLYRKVAPTKLDKRV